MRVRHIISNYSMYSGGAQRVIRALHLGLLERGIDSTIFALMAQPESDALPAARTLGLPSPYDPRAFTGILRYVRSELKPDDLVHVHLFPPVFYVALLKAFNQVPGRLIYTEHSTSNRRRGSLVGSLLDRVTYSGYERIVAISRGVEQELLKWKPELVGRVSVIYNGVNLPVDHPIDHQPGPVLRILSIGNLRPAKNYGNALRAIALLSDLDLEYQIAGVGEEEESLRALVRELGLEKRTRFLGYLDLETVRDRLSEADLFLMPSLWEGFGIAAVEAMSASLPLVLSDVVGLREIAAGNLPCAELVDPRSPESIAAGIRTLAADAALRRTYGARAYSQAGRFTVEKMVDQYINLYGQYN